MDMMNAIVGVLSGFFGVILMRFLVNTYETKRQEKMEREVSEIKKKSETLKAEIKEEDKKTQDKVNEITTEQNIELVGNALADFFNNHKGKH